MDGSQPPSQPSVSQGESVALVVYTDQQLTGSTGMPAKQVRMAGYAAVGVFLFALGFLVVSFAMPGPIGGLIAGAIALLVFVVYHIIRRPGRVERERCKKLIRPSSTPGRVRCEGKPSRIARIMRMEPLADTMFEPRVFRGTGAIKSSGVKMAVQIVVGVAVGVGTCWAQWHYTQKIGNAYLDFMFAVTAAMIIGGAMFPTYLRVVPGRIDIMECGWLGKKILSVKQLDLRTKPIIVDLNRQIVQVGDSVDALTIGFGAVWDNWGFAHAALMAAVSTHEPAPLPDDALVG